GPNTAHPVLAFHILPPRGGGGSPAGAPAGRPPPPANLNGSERAIAGICNAGGNVLGLMPHPERCAEEMLGNRDGLGLLAGAVAAGGGRVGALAAAGG
ncbi:MAG: hypothetical protein F4X59_02340, partial [Holophagales bacterium]|nr:hypothetical protein [Holophagales bacterium]